MHREGHLDDVYWVLRVGLGSTAFLAGLDKFTNLLTNWEIAGDLILDGHYDTAVRDVNMALAAYALARSEGSRRQRRESLGFGEDSQLERAA